MLTRRSLFAAGAALLGALGLRKRSNEPWRYFGTPLQDGVQPVCHTGTLNQLDGMVHDRVFYGTWFSGTCDGEPIMLRRCGDGLELRETPHA